MANPLQRSEEIEIQVMVYNRYLNNRPLGSTKFSLHRLLDEPSIQLAASLVDANEKPLKVTLCSFIIVFLLLGKAPKLK